MELAICCITNAHAPYPVKAKYTPITPDIIVPPIVAKKNFRNSSFDEIYAHNIDFKAFTGNTKDITLITETKIGLLYIFARNGELINKIM